MTCCGTPPVELLTGAVSGQVHLQERELLASSQMLDDERVQTDFVVPGMHCIACIRTLETEIGKLDFVEKVRANLSLKKVSIVWNLGAGRIVEIDEAITNVGFDHSPFDLHHMDASQTQKASTKLLIALAVAGFAAVNIMLLSVSVWSGADAETTRLFHLISGVIAVPTVFFSGRPFFVSALSSLRVGRLNMDVPISLAVLLALGMSVYESMIGGQEAYFDAAVTLLFFLLIGRYLDHLMREKARSSVVQLSQLTAKGAMVIDEDGSLSYAELSEIQPGMTIRIMAGERVSVDGDVIAGSSDLDRSLVTGESTPIAIGKGGAVEAGTLNLTGAIDVLVTRDARHSFLAEIIRMMEAAEKGRGKFTRIADRMAQIYAPAVHVLAAAAFIGWMIATGGQWHQSIYVAISVLIITCPCALGLAVPVAHVIAARRLFRQGILIRDGSAFERLEEVSYILFDKTGTLTSSTPQATLPVFENSVDASIAKTLATHSAHPYSKAVASTLEYLDPCVVDDIQEVPGAGMEGLIDGTKVRLGRVSWAQAILSEQDNEPAKDGGFGFAVAGGKLVRIELHETLRQEAQQAIVSLKNSGIGLALVSGDGEKRVAKVAEELAIEDWFATQSPADKLSLIQKAAQSGSKILMVGDGLNDSPALAAAHVSMAPANACDIARQNADFVFTRPSLAAVPFAIETAQRTGRIVHQNFGLAIIYNSIAIPFAIAGMVTPLIAAIAMSASSIVVVANSMRLNGGKDLDAKSEEIAQGSDPIESFLHPVHEQKP